MSKTFMCKAHAAQTPCKSVESKSETVAVTPKVRCFALTKRTLRCNNIGKGGLFLYGHQFPHGVYLCPSHYKSLSREHADVDRYLKDEIDRQVRETSIVSLEERGKESNLSSSSSSEEGEVESNSSFSLLEEEGEAESNSSFGSSKEEGEAEINSSSSSSKEDSNSSLHKKEKSESAPPKKKVRRRKYKLGTYDAELKPRKRQKAVRCIGIVERRIRGSGRTVPGRCAQVGHTDGVYRCKSHRDQGPEYRRCPGNTKAGFRCIRVGIPKSGDSYHCHQHRAAQ